MQKNNQASLESEEDFIDIKELLSECCRRWKWFLFSLSAVLFLAIMYLLCTPPVYVRTAQVLIKSDSKGASISGAADAIENLGLITTNTSVNNELLAMVSPDVMSDVVELLNLQVEYKERGLFRDNTLYGSNLPVKVEYLNQQPSTSVDFDLEISEDQKFRISKFKAFEGGVSICDAYETEGRLNDTITTPAGLFLIVKNDKYLKNPERQSIHVTIIDKMVATETFAGATSLSLVEKNAEVVEISVNDVSQQRGDDIISTLISVYNRNWIQDKNQVAVNTSMFINDRLKVIESELSDVDDDISKYKSKNLLPDVREAAQMYMHQNAEISTQIQNLSNQRYMMRYIREYLSSAENQTKLLPVSSGISNANIESQISEYNSKLLQRNRLEANSSSENALVMQLDGELDVMRSAIVVSIDNQIVSIDNQISTLEQSERTAIARIASNPEQAKTLLSVERQQSVKQALYVFLLQKREETELSQAFTAYNTRIIKKPGGSLVASSPKKKNVLLIAVLLGLLIPLAIIFLKESMNTKLRGRKDLSRLSAPLVGEIPNAHRPEKWWKLKKEKHNAGLIVVKKGRRDVINEAFRVLRTNIEFMLNDDKNVFMLTSYNAGSGKSFLTANIAMSLAIKGKKVLMVDGDMRHASLSTLVGSGKKGLADYLNGQQTDVRSVIVPVDDKVDIIPVGTIPPNPTELIGGDLFSSMIEKFRKEYDYILIDCPPIEIVADAHIVEKHVDRVFFVIRSGLLERSMIDDLNHLYEEGGLKNMSVILNGTESNTGKYGYKYGYYSSYANETY